MTAEYPTVPVAPAPAQSRQKRRRRWPWWVLGGLVLLAVLLVVADIGARAYAQGRAESEIRSQLPTNLQGDVSVSIGGFSFLSQLVAGSFHEVQLDAPALTVDGVPLAAHVTATDVPTDLSKPVGDIQATVTLDQAAVDSIVALPGDASLVLGDGAVSYDGQVTVLGLTIGYRITGTVQASGTDVVIQPQSAALTQGSNLIDLSGVLGGLTKNPITVCVAQYLPQGATVQSIDVTSGQVSASLAAQQFVLSEDSLRTLGTCP